MSHALPSHRSNGNCQSTQSQIADLTDSLRDSKVHLLLAASGSVATIKLPLIVKALSVHPNLSIRVLLTPSARRFLAGQAAEQPTVSSLHDFPSVDAVYFDEDEWKEPWKRGNSILHIELRRWADMLVIAPLSANTMAKIVGGMADGIITSVVRAWDARGELDSDVAMNTAMWRHPITAKQIKTLSDEWGVGKDGQGNGWFEVLSVQQKTLACGDIGDGAMMEWTEIVKVIEDRLNLTES
ncbi:halotolerance protein [Truncatella angustata]|uniref:Halotolerance protein n=1 Tax=Truncatella angustata TaxID=152316 RepID=A0A9P9A0L7_9PEZI|nr:halotolerance protein [Truncatella angustata]KAH6656124.1 halotolerance protein [Truncatella angustata]